VLPKCSLEKTFDIQMDWEDWCHKEELCLSKGLIWYSDGSKLTMDQGLKFMEKTSRHDICLIGQYTTIF
jgi:hypothetical protein